MTVTEILETNPEKLDTFDPNKPCYKEENDYFYEKKHIFSNHQLQIRHTSLKRDEILGQKLQLFGLAECAKILTGRKFYEVITQEMRSTKINTCLHYRTPRLFLMLLPLIASISIIYSSVNFNPKWLLCFIPCVIGSILLGGFTECSGVFNEWDLELDDIEKLIIRLPWGVAMKYEEAMESNLFDDVLVLAPKSCWEREVYRDPLLLGKIGDEYAILAQW